MVSTPHYVVSGLVPVDCRIMSSMPPAGTAHRAQLRSPLQWFEDEPRRTPAPRFQFPHDASSHFGRSLPQRFVYCGAFRARLRPGFLRSFTRGSRVRSPARLRTGRSSGL